MLVSRTAYNSIRAQSDKANLAAWDAFEDARMEPTSEALKAEAKRLAEIAYDKETYLQCCFISESIL
jgi:hypothetical protein